MKTLQFKCTLLSDIILNQKAATEGANSTLDFIPGSNFLGIAAGKLYPECDSKVTWTLFHSGKVRFGDAHPAYKGNNGELIRSLRTPADMFYPKQKNLTEECYIMHLTDGKAEDIKKLQLKQCRSGFYAFEGNTAHEIKTDISYAIKSAHDKERRTSKDKQMYGYQSLDKGLEMLFDVEIEDESLETTIVDALVGKKRVGRSRSAQYGLVEIEKCKYKECESMTKGDMVIVYADSRLIFIDEKTGMPTFQMTSKQLGLEAGEIEWDKSQIRTFQYSPWNYKRQCFDTDRCGIEKGSVIVVKNAKCDSISKYIGNYQNEGFGKVIYNPCFLEAEQGGKAKISFISEKENVTSKGKKEISTPLISFLKSLRNKEESEAYIYKTVNNFVSMYYARFTTESFASQWGTIRSMATLKTESPIDKRLFGEKDGYLQHGVAEEKWRLRGRRETLKKFVDSFDSEEKKRLALINLSAEMAKRCRKEDKK